MLPRRPLLRSSKSQFGQNTENSVVNVKSSILFLILLYSPFNFSHDELCAVVKLVMTIAADLSM